MKFLMLEMSETRCYHFLRSVTMQSFPEFVDPYDPSSGDIFIRTEHLARYIFAAEFIGRRGLKRVLDAACGNGYGSRILAERAQIVEGADKNANLIERGIYRISADAIQNVRLRAADLNGGLGFFENGSFDCAVCFETLEHVEKDAALLREFARVLRKGGWLLLSVPKAGYEPVDGEGRTANPWHLRLYGEGGLRELLSGCGFFVQKMLGQPYSNVLRVRMEDYVRDTGISREDAARSFIETPESLGFFARLWGWPVEECPEKSNVLIAVCRKV
jgi:SAM-dependent methyltransferase